MNIELINEYKKYLSSEEAAAVLFVKKYLKKSQENWIDILSSHAPYHYDTRSLEFEEVRCELFPRRTKPVYPARPKGMDEQEYRMICSAITWKTAHQDIDYARQHGYQGPVFCIRGRRYKANRPPMFLPDAPIEYRKLDPNVRTDPLWDTAQKYMNPAYLSWDGYDYRVTGIKRIR